MDLAVHSGSLRYRALFPQLVVDEIVRCSLSDLNLFHDKNQALAK